MSHVYFVQVGDGPIKIGFASDISKRIGELQIANHEQLHLRALIAGGRAKEAEYHLRFAQHRISGEWFRPAAAILQEIIRIYQFSADARAAAVPRLAKTSSLSHWYAVRCVQAQQDVRTAVLALRDDYAAFCIARGDAIDISPRAFGDFLNERGHPKHKSKGRISRSGISLRPSSSLGTDAGTDALLGTIGHQRGGLIIGAAND